ncbi:hypothetical protein [Alkalihalobacillus sp. AL-G]|uniref:hypothetical protein n=1 Tax=Alkalihalobacillus sp. AL-G TaxID=2926399 RepID=UPI00272A8A33|nr:hypothetical protein [Alkalihalobacillus sp. AL-G]WLD92879.1 hypothetical protein MOJ78_18020 [Alkalihalobacillus sp. AL-G]
MKNTKLRIVWIIPNVFCYLLLFGLTMWVVANGEGLREINRLSIYVIFMILLFLVSVFGSYRIWRWIKEGKM